MKIRSTCRRFAGPVSIAAVLAVTAGLGPLATARADVPVTTIATVPVQPRGPVISRGHDGSVLAAWIEGSAIRVATRPVGGAWGEPQDVANYQGTRAANGDEVSPDSLSLVRARDGSALLSWEVLTSDRSGHVDVALRHVDGTWTAPAAIQTISGEPGLPAAGVAEDGTFVVAAFTDQGIRVLSRTPGGLWSASAVPGSTAAFTGEESRCSLAVAPDGTVTVLWTSGHPYAAVRRRDGTWSRPVNLGGNAISLSHGVLAVGRDGTVAVAWPDTGPGEGTAYRIRTALHRPGHPWVTSYRTRRGDRADVTSIAVGPHATTTLLWDVDTAPGAHRFQMTTDRPAHGWSRPVTMGPVFRIGPGAHVTVDRRGRRLLTWSGVLRGETVDSIWTRWSTRGGWTRPVRLTGAAGESRRLLVGSPALGDHGVVSLLWERRINHSDGPDYRIETADVHRP